MVSIRASYAGVTFFYSLAEAAYSMGVLDFREFYM
jgi:hypothetical protein